MQAEDSPLGSSERVAVVAQSSAEMVASYRSTGDARAREDLVKRHIKLVRQIAASHSRSADAATQNDLAQVGCIGLLNAIERFDPSMGRSFEAYAGACIAGEIRHYLRDHGQLVRLPRELQELRPQVVRATARLSQHSHRTPTPEEIAGEIGAPLEKVIEVLELEEKGAPVSLDDECEADPGKALKYQLIDNRYRSFQLATEDRIMLGQAMARLKDVSREVIEFAFFEDLTQTEIAKHLGISQMQVSRRVRSALGELWKHLNSRLWD